MIIINDIEIEVYILDTRESLINRIAYKLNVLPKYIYFIGTDNKEKDINLPYILNMVKENIKLKAKTLNDIISSTKDLKEFLEKSQLIFENKIEEGKSLKSDEKISINELFFYWISKKFDEMLQTNKNFILNDFIGQMRLLLGNNFSSITIENENEYNEYKSIYNENVKNLDENVKNFNGTIKGTTNLENISKFISFNTVSETVTFTFDNKYDNTIESLFDKLNLGKVVPFAQLVSKKFENLSCFKTLKNNKVYSNFYDNFKYESDIDDFEEKREKTRIIEYF